MSSEKKIVHAEVTDVSNDRKVVHTEILVAEMKEQLLLGNKVKFRISGMSMWPFLCHSRDCVILEAIKPQDIRIGQIVLLRKQDGAWLLHRVTAANKDQIQTTGDGKLTRDGWYPRESVLGAANQLIRKGREISCDQLPWKLLMDIWRVCFPIRGILIRVIALLRHHT